MKKFYGEIQEGESDCREAGNRLNHHGEEKSIFENVFGKRCPDWSIMKCHAFFAVPKQNILRHPRICYERLLDLHFFEHNRNFDAMPYKMEYM